MIQRPPSQQLRNDGLVGFKHSRSLCVICYPNASCISEEKIAKAKDAISYEGFLKRVKLIWSRLLRSAIGIIYLTMKLKLGLSYRGFKYKRAASAYVKSHLYTAEVVWLMGIFPSKTATKKPQRYHRANLYILHWLGPYNAGDLRSVLGLL